LSTSSWKNIGTDNAIKCIASAATTTSRNSRRSANSLRVNQEKPNAASSLARRPRRDQQRCAVPGALKVGAGEEKHLAIAIERVGDGDFSGPSATHAHHRDGVALFSSSKNGWLNGRLRSRSPVEYRAARRQGRIRPPPSTSRDTGSVSPSIRLRRRTAPISA
jgi:hypothetical protein